MRLYSVQLRVPLSGSAMADRFFNLEEAEKLIPTLEQLLNTAMESKKTMEAVDAMLAQVKSRIMVMGGLTLDHQNLSQIKSRKDDSATHLKDVLQQITDSGCLVKDLDIGLVDFPCLVNNREIYLCWKLGEPKIGFWHNVEEGFPGRKPLDPEVLKGMQPPRLN